VSNLILFRHPEFGRGPREDVDALSVVLAFRKTLVPEEDRQAWLAWRRVRYLLVGGLGLSTTMGMVRLPPRGGLAAPDRVLEAEQNSDVCAAFSAIMDSDGSHRVYEVLKTYER
jgi:hypothetical protein